ncbi:hypothetical protein IAU59_005243 [Kwoniella sp. CBS 9459]
MFGNNLLPSGEITPNIWDPRQEAVRLYSDGRSGGTPTTNPSTRSSSVPRSKAPDVPDWVDPLYPRPPEKVYVAKTPTSATTRPVKVAGSGTGTANTVDTAAAPSVTVTSEVPTHLDAPPVTMPSEPSPYTTTSPEALSNATKEPRWWRPQVKIWVDDSPSSENATIGSTSLPEGTSVSSAASVFDNVTRDVLPSSPGTTTRV